MTPVRGAISVAGILFLSAVTPASTQQDEPGAGGELFEKMQSEFAEAYNRKDVPAMAGFFSENGVRITPAGIFRGRDAIGRELQRVVIDLGFTITACGVLSRAWKVAWFLTPESGKPNLAMASSFEATIRRFWSVKALE
jgi:hypothetical protein